MTLSPFDIVVEYAIAAPAAFLNVTAELILLLFTGAEKLTRIEGEILTLLYRSASWMPSTITASLLNGGGGGGGGGGVSLPDLLQLKAIINNINKTYR